MGKLIVIEGTDASGKETQANMLYEFLKSANKKVKKISFPNYESMSSSLVKMYLRGDFGENPEDVNAYAASAFYAVDRYASFKTLWEDFLKEEDSFVIADRYVTSNMVHQAAKIKDESEKQNYLDWLYDFEYEKLALPKPHIVIFLAMEPEASHKLMANRKNKITGDEEKDIHEVNQDYLKHSYDNACFIAQKYDWKKVKCSIDGEVRTPEEIHNDVISIINGDC